MRESKKERQIERKREKARQRERESATERERERGKETERGRGREGEGGGERESEKDSALVCVHVVTDNETETKSVCVLDFVCMLSSLCQGWKVEEVVKMNLI